MMQSWEIILLSIEEEYDVMWLFEANEFLFFAKRCTVCQSISQKSHLLLLFLPVDKDRLVSG